MTKSKAIILFSIIVFVSLVFYGIFKAKNKIYINVVCFENQDTFKTDELASRIRYFVGINKNIKTIEMNVYNYEGIRSFTLKKSLVKTDGVLIELEDTLKVCLKDNLPYPFLTFVSNHILVALDKFKESDGNKQILVIFGSLPNKLPNRLFSLARTKDLIQRLDKLDKTNKDIEIMYLMTYKTEQEKLLFDYFVRNYGSKLTDKRLGI